MLTKLSSHWQILCIANSQCNVVSLRLIKVAVLYNGHFGVDTNVSKNTTSRRFKSLFFKRLRQIPFYKYTKTIVFLYKNLSVRLKWIHVVFKLTEVHA